MMHSMFKNNRAPQVPSHQRRPGATTKLPLAVHTKHLDILPDLLEKDEDSLPPSPTASFDSSRSYVGGFTPCRNISSSVTPVSRSAKDLAERKRDSRRVVLTGAEGLSFDDFFPQVNAPARRAVAPHASFIHPLASSSSGESPLDDINLRFSGLGISLNFPSPPSAGTDNCVTPTLTKRRDHSPHSPTSSIASTASSSGSSFKATLSTPPTSDDECTSRLKRAPTFKSHRASIIYAKSLSDLHHPVSPSLDDDCWTEEDAAWFAEHISDVVTLASPLPPSFPLEQQGRARPDSVMPSAQSSTVRSRRESKVLPPTPALAAKPVPKGPSLQLDPMFPARRRSFRIPDRLPPPPPSPPTHRHSTMEEETDDLLAQLANAALSSGYFSTTLTVPGQESTSVPPTPSSGYIVSTPSSERQRPPPRMSVPADISDSFDFGDSPIREEFSGDVYLAVPSQLTSYPAWPSSPGSESIYSQASMTTSPKSPVLIDFDFDIIISSDCDAHSVDLPFSPALPDTPEIMKNMAPERNLRSRWSSSTLGSLAERQAQSSSSWISRFTLSPSKKNKAAASATATTSSTKRSSVLRTPLSPTFKKLSFDFDGGLQRRDSRSSRMSDGASDSGESSTSSGLRRKPIPVEIFMRT